jgi:hypothetical protein
VLASKHTCIIAVLCHLAALCAGSTQPAPARCATAPHVATTTTACPPTGIWLSNWGLGSSCTQSGQGKWAQARQASDGIEERRPVASIANSKHNRKAQTSNAFK